MAIMAKAGISLSILRLCSNVMARYPARNTMIIMVSIFVGFFKDFFYEVKYRFKFQKLKLSKDI